MYCLHPQALKVRNPLWAQAHAKLAGVDRGCTKGRQSTTQQAACGIDTKADESATTTHRRLILAALCSCLSEIRVTHSLAMRDLEMLDGSCRSFPSIESRNDSRGMLMMMPTFTMCMSMRNFFSSCCTHTRNLTTKAEGFAR